MSYLGALLTERRVRKAIKRLRRQRELLLEEYRHGGRLLLQPYPHVSPTIWECTCGEVTEMACRLQS